MQVLDNFRASAEDKV